MNGKHLFLTSAGLTDKMKEKFFDIIGKCPKDVKVLYIPTAGIETDGARESLAICFHELFLMGIQYENILVYNLELILSKDRPICHRPACVCQTFSTAMNDLQSILPFVIPASFSLLVFRPLSC